MFNSTRTPREVLGYIAGLSLNFLFRYLMDFSIFLLVVSFFSVRSRLYNLIRYLYIITLSIFTLFLILSAIFPSLDDQLSAINYNYFGLIGIRNGNLIYLTACLFTPLMITGKITGLLQSLKFYSKIPGASVLLLLFVILVPMQVLDTLTFYGLIRQNLELYYLRIYTPFIGFTFAYVIWLRWIENERRTEATLRVGQISKEVATILAPQLLR